MRPEAVRTAFPETNGKDQPFLIHNIPILQISIQKKYLTSIKFYGIMKISRKGGLYGCIA